MLRIALTGGIATGKSTVSQLFAEKGVHIIDADKISHSLTEPHTDTCIEIAAHFGADIITTEGKLDRQRLRTIIFKDPTKRIWLENLLHPLIRAQMQRELSQVTSPYCLLVIPLLKPEKPIDFIDRICVISTTLQAQLDRAKQRDRCPETLIQQIIASQPSNAQRAKMADDIITNDESHAHLKEQVDKLHQKYLQLSTEND